MVDSVRCSWCVLPAVLLDLHLLPLLLPGSVFPLLICHFPLFELMGSDFAIDLLLLVQIGPFFFVSLDLVFNLFPVPVLDFLHFAPPCILLASCVILPLLPFLPVLVLLVPLSWTAAEIKV
jgi:hypothetical protein